MKQPRVSEAPEPADRQRGGRIVVGVHGSPGSLAALRWALSEAARSPVIVAPNLVEEGRTGITHPRAQWGWGVTRQPRGAGMA